MCKVWQALGLPVRTDLKVLLNVAVMIVSLKAQLPKITTQCFFSGMLFL